MQMSHFIFCFNDSNRKYFPSPLSHNNQNDSRLSCVTAGGNSHSSDRAYIKRLPYISSERVYQDIPEKHISVKLNVCPSARANKITILSILYNIKWIGSFT